MFNLHAQIQIGGNVYGGGNSADVLGNTKVTVCKGELKKVFGGARMANVGCTTFVNIDGKESTGDILISEVYGGNDIAGTIGQSEAATTVPAELENVIPEPTEEQIAEAGSKDKYIENYKKDHPKLNVVDNTWKTFVKTSRSTKTDPDDASKTIEDNWILVGSLYGGGNGNFVYTDDNGNPLKDNSGNYIVNEVTTADGTATTTTIATKKTPFTLPEIDKTYLELKGGELAHVYGGGNKATVRENTTINIDNESESCQGYVTKTATALWNADAAHTGGGKGDFETTGEHSWSHYYLSVVSALRSMSKLSTFQSNITSFDFNYARVFGGNNLAEMSIRPTWNLQQGIIRDLYSGGNRGNMTSPEGLLLEIDPAEKNTTGTPDPTTKNNKDLVVDNVFGGCRMADVMPSVNGIYTPTSNLPGYGFPNELSARVLVRGGDINNVYGGNDITGTVYGGNAVGIYTTIRGDVYGGGNGAYAYTDQTKSGDDEEKSDFYYSTEGYGSSYDALNAHRPNAEQVSIRLAGTSAANPTIIKGSVFVGGNCASVATEKANPTVQLKIGSHVIADKVFLGNNGEKMVNPDILSYYKDENYSSLDLTDPIYFADYMSGAAMSLQPSVVFDNTSNGDPANYVPYSSYVGSFFCGGNVGSMAIPSKNIYNISQGLNIFEKFVGGCNSADVTEQYDEDGTTKLCASYEGGVLGAENEREFFTDSGTESGNIRDRLEINLANLTITPLRWNDPTAKQYLIWNTNKWSESDNAFVPVPNSDVDNKDHSIRLLGGNIYGGCYNSGHVNGNVVININEDIMKKDETFGEKADPSDRYPSGVLLEDQRDDLEAIALAVFGAGYGEKTEIWGSTTVNHNNGYAFQIFGGGEEGVVGRKRDVKNSQGVVTDQEYYFDPAYSSTVNLNGTTAIYSSTDAAEGLAETEYIYGGGNEGNVCGNTLVNLGNGRIFDAFGGASNADILGHTEVFIGRQPNGSGGYKAGFPWIKDIVYGGNDFGGTIHGEYEDDYDFTNRLRNFSTYSPSIHGTPTAEVPGVLQSSTYVEYLQGRVDSIYGGSYGYYDYADTSLYGSDSEMPSQESSFVNIRPEINDNNALLSVFGGGTGYPGNRAGDSKQDRSYVLIDIPDETDRFSSLQVFGAGSYNGLGMRFSYDSATGNTVDDEGSAISLDNASAIVDLLHGQVDDVFGGSFNEGNTRRTVVNVPAASTINIGNIFGGAYGTQTLPPCDVYESHVNYRSDLATVKGAIYGGNNNERRTLYAHVNIYSPVWKNKDKNSLSTVYGAGRGQNSWAEYTEVNLENGAQLEEVYGGGENGHVVNTESIMKYMKDGWEAQGCDSVDDPKWLDAWTLGDYFKPASGDDFNNYLDNAATNLTNSATVRKAEMDDRDYSAYTAAEKAKREYRYNTNVIIKEGAYVANYAYGGGLGKSGTLMPGDIWGSTYIALLGGQVIKDIYAGGTIGSVCDKFLGGVGLYDASSRPGGFMASANAYIKGGSCRNVYGGGWQGDVGTHRHPDTLDDTEDISLAPTADIPGETHIVIGDLAGTSFTNGIPAIQRNAYGGGEGEQGGNGGMVFGTTHLRLNNGYVGYEYKDGAYTEKIEDDTQPKPNILLIEAGCLFGGGYTDNSYVDKTVVNIYGGHVRNSAFGGGEVAAIGRGDMKAKTGDGGDYELKGIYRPGKTQIEMYGGHVHQNIYGGGRGYDNLGRVGTLHSSGYVFGQTEVYIHGGEIGTVSGLADGDGNVFGGGDEGFVYSAYENADGTFGRGVKPTGSERYKDDYQGYYYKHQWYGDTSTGSNIDSEGFYTEDVTVDGTTTKERMFTEDCKVVVEPWMKATSAVTINGHSYKVGDYVPIDDLNTLGNKNDETWASLDQTGIIIHNAVFAGGNRPSNSLTTNANTTTVFGNATASVNDIFHRDMITLGTRHTGGLYGDGNLTLVDGYRELNITNYGTDYYSIAKQIGIDAYHALPSREADYYELRYKCLKDCTDKDGTQYKKATTDANGFTTKASTITADEMQSLFVVEKEVTEDGKTVKKKVSVTDGENGPAILVYDEEKGEWIPNPNGGAPYWEENGVLPVYAGRLMNSIQRADFCGVFGSRMVMQGAQDRVPEEADYTNYTINRVREVSLNKKTIGGVERGNYFGIYNIVNYLGALTSDVDFGDESSGTVRTTDNTDEATYQCAAGTGGKAYGTATYYDWKKAFRTERKRNNGSSRNKVALASGVYLELTTEESTGDGLYEKVWGPITGVVELDLINVSTGIGGGFVYAKNEHGVRSKTTHKNTTLAALNAGAVTKWDYDYSTTEDADHQLAFETSGNFVHSTQTIIDDCYNVSSRYMGEGKMPAHYWYIKGSTYVYDQYISAYTGVPNAYSESVDIPLTIAAASHGKMKLLNVMPNRYAYYSSPGVKLGEGKKVVINDKTYYQNDPISYWDWYLLSKSEKELFVEKTYTNCMTYYDADGTEHKAGTVVMTDTEFATYKSPSHVYNDAEGQAIQKADKSNADDDYIFRSSNIVGHDTGYILTYEVNNPSKWDNWFTPRNDSYTGKKTLKEYEAMDVNTKASYYDGPTYRLAGETGMLLGQRDYEEGDLIAKSMEDTYQAIAADNKPEEGQAIFEEAYIVTSTITVTEGSAERHYNEGSTVSKTFADSHSGSTEEAYICTNTIEVAKEEIIFKDSKMTKTKAEAYVTDVETKMGAAYKDKTLEAIKALPTTGTGAVTAEKKKELIELATLRDDLKTYLVPAYYCTTAGKYGGNYYEAGKNYRGLEAWSSMTADDQSYFTFNYDALDLLIDPTYSRAEGQKYQYDGNYTSEDQVNGKVSGIAGNPAGYSVTQSVDYTATYDGSETTDKTETVDAVTKRYMEVSQSIIPSGKVYVGDELTREVYESLPNEQRHYAPVSVPSAGTYYVVNTAFQIGSTPYAVGETISSESYSGLPSEEQACVTPLVFGKSHESKTFYYCHENYAKGGNVTPIASTGDGSVAGAAGGISSDGEVLAGTLISSDDYKNLPNQQRNFTIHGVSPTETSTFYVSRESNIYDLSKEKIITVIYKYDYDETDSQGNVRPISERHVVNIHLTFKSGVPTVADITQPGIILPGDFTTLREPTVTPGAYEVMGGGWELFEREHDAESHSNGIDYDPKSDPLYWYQDGYFVAYYAKSYAGRTYSNYVPVSVANYHDLAEVMSDENKAHHMYIDNKNVKREPKIYINDYSASGKNGLDLFKNLYDLSLRTEVATSGALTGHALLDNRVKAGQNLEFFLRTDIRHTGTWTPIASGVDEPCFNGILHGDGHAISGLTPADGTTGSLFSKLCGSVYNLGVMGSFTGAGVADSGDGYVESCWVKTTAASIPSGTKAVFGGNSAVSYEQTVNCYYPESNSGYTAGKATAMPDRAFYNGEVAYDLNNFYLYKRYSDHTAPSGSTAGYQYWLPGAATPQTGYYESNPGLCSSGYTYTYTPDGKTEPVTLTLKYVEDRFADGDFRFAVGNTSGIDDERHWVETVTTGSASEEVDHWSPIWPDDYIFFGQKLTYDWASETHQDVPTAVVRDGGRLSPGDDANRVYRAPAYFGSKAMGAAHFNPKAYLAQTKKNVPATLAYPGMTAIDFAGHNDTHELNGPTKPYLSGRVSGGSTAGSQVFYPPLLDDDGLTGIVNCDETRNLLVYAPAAAAATGYANAATHAVLTAYFTDPDYDDYYDNNDGYRLVHEKPEAVGVYGHLVQNNLRAVNDHFLVDKQDFNAPLAYTFDAGHRMWYQRKPADKEYVEPVWTGSERTTKGWQGISLPFTAELVTTQQKGELTHFYQGNTTGHEYWLRGFNAIKTENEVAKAELVYPDASGTEKNYTNTFLWDYYYKNTSVHNQKDKNDDTYQTYYNRSHIYSGYPLLATATPYIIGLPGNTYYEFDLSGKFEPKNTAADNNPMLSINKLEKQVITFASNTGITIDVSDDEVQAATAANTKSGYAFVPSYMKRTVDAGTNTYTLDADGDSYDKVPATGSTTTVEAFRPYFVQTSPSRIDTRSIVFANNDGEEHLKHEEHGSSDEPGTIIIGSKRHKILVTSTLSNTVAIRIVNSGGITLATFDLKPGETVETRVSVSGVYMVETVNDKYVKKIVVK